jgi:Tol biopolymer transport system component
VHPNGKVNAPVRTLPHRTLAALPLVAGLLALAGPACNGGDDGGAPTAVVFYSNRDGDDDVYIMNLDGSGLRQLTNEPGRDYEGDISPDGTTIVFASQRDTGGNSQLFLMDAAGGNVRRLTFSADRTAGAVIDDYPHWSPDGKRIVFQRSTDATGSMDADVWIIDPAIGEERQLTNLPDMWDSTPAFTPDSAAVLFERGSGPNFSIYRVDIETGEATRLTGDEAGRAVGGKISPDGTKLLFTSNVDGDVEIYVQGIDGGTLTNLTNNDADDTYPHWSPDGKRILFGSDRDGNPEIYTMNADGTDVRRVTNDPGKDSDPHWSRAR